MVRFIVRFIIALMSLGGAIGCSHSDSKNDSMPIASAEENSRENQITRNPSPSTSPSQQAWGELVSAVAKGDLAKVTHLVPTIIEPNTRHPRDGTTPLILAAMAGERDIAEFLLSKGADINAKDQQGLTALMQAALHGAPTVMYLLMANGADVTLQDNKGRSARVFATAVLEEIRKEPPVSDPVERELINKQRLLLTECVADLEKLEKRGN